MQLTLYTDYSMRMLLYLGVMEDGTIAEIAQNFQISRNHLVKVAHHLGKAGYVHTMRGRSGGLKLARPPEQIRIGDVVRDMEPHFKMAACFTQQLSTCTIAGGCRLKDLLAEAQHAFLAVLDRHTLADLLEDKELLLVLLRAHTPVAEPVG